MKKLFLLISALFLSSAVFAAIPEVPLKINFEGSFSTGPISISFCISSQAVSGSELPGINGTAWSESITTATTDGFVSYVLGSQTTGGIPRWFFTGASNQRYLEVNTTTGSGNQLSFIELESVPFAYRASLANELTGGTTVNGDLTVGGNFNVNGLTNVISTQPFTVGGVIVSSGAIINGNVVIGTANTNANLYVVGTATVTSSFYVGGAISKTGNTLYGTNSNTQVNLGNSSVMGQAGGGEPSYNMYCAIGGGFNNTVTPSYSTVSGGQGNIINYGDHSFIGGGYLNNICNGGGGTNSYSVISGGANNVIYAFPYDDASFASIVGGTNNSCNSTFSTICGGESNTAEGYASIVLGGENNSSCGDYSVTAGRNTEVQNNGSFAFGDGDNTRPYFSVNSANTFGAVFKGGYWFTGGNVGIGTTIPGQKLSVNGIVQSTSGGFMFPDGTVMTSTNALQGITGPWFANGSNIYNTNSGSVSIGITNPQGFFQVRNSLTVLQNGNVNIGTSGTPVTTTIYGPICGGINNSIPANNSSIICGGSNIISSADYSVISGGRSNGIIDQGGTGGTYYSVIAGGANNYIVLRDNNNAGTSYSAISGGVSNHIYSPYSTICGGVNNEIDGFAATVLGGESNQAYGDYSVVAGLNTYANADGCFIFGDGDGSRTPFEIDPPNSNTFAAVFKNGYWLTGGNVGVGTTAPDQKLNVAGNISQSGVLISSGTTGNNYFAGNVGIGTPNPVDKLHVISTGGGNGLVVGPANASNGYGLRLSYDNVSGGALVDSMFDNAFSLMRFRMRTQGTAVDAMTIMGNSYVGIGTTAPDQKLNVIGNISQTGIIISSGTAGNNYFAGNIGVGKTNPGTALDVNGTVTATSFSGNGSGLTGVTASNVTWGNINGTLSNQSDLSTALSAKAPIANPSFTGNVGIGTATPDQTLNVVGNISQTGVIISSGTTGNNYFAGNVGIGTTNPGQALEVNGTIMSNTGMAQTFMGYSGALGSGKIGTVNNYPFGIVVNNDNSKILFMTTSGNVGIGTTNPGTVLDVLQTQTVPANYSAFFRNSNPGGQAGLVNWNDLGNWAKITKGGSILNENVFGVNQSGAFDLYTNIGNVNLGTGDSSNITLGTSNVPRVTILGNGNVGIGTTLPGAKLEIGSSGYDAGVMFSRGANAAKGYIGGFGDSNGAVQINVANGYVNSDGALVQNDSTKPTWYTSLDARSTQDTFHVARRPAGGSDSIFLSIDNCGNVSVNGYTQLGSNSPSIQMKQISGNMPSSDGATYSLPHGLTGSKIISAFAVLNYSNGSAYVPQNYTHDSLQYDIYWNSVDVFLLLKSGNDSNCFGCPVTVTILYQQ
jgi:hypothetical protein